MTKRTKEATPDVVDFYDKDHPYVVIGASAAAGVFGPNMNKRKWYKTRELAEAEALGICKTLNMDGRTLELLVMQAVARAHSTPPNDAEIGEV